LMDINLVFIMSKINRPVIPLNLINTNTDTTHYNWKLVRERDGLTKYSEEILWIDYNEDGTFKSKHSEPSNGRSLLMSPFNNFFTWQTTIITEILEVSDDLIVFDTENSRYHLYRTND